MQTKSQVRRQGGNDGKKKPGEHVATYFGAPVHRRARFSASTKGIRLLPEQIEWVNSEIAKDPEETWSRMVRAGLNLLRKQREGLIQVLSPVAR